MNCTPDIFRELDRLAQRRGWTQADLARQMGVDRTVFAHLRAGRKTASSRFLARAARAFAEEDSLRDVIWHYLRYEMPVGAEEPVIRVEPGDVPALSSEAEQTLHEYVRTFPRHLVDGRGLVIRSDSAPLLSSAASLVADSLRRAGVVVAQRTAHLPVLPSEAIALRRARLLVVERAEYASAAVQGVIAERLQLEQPVVVTTATDLSGRLEDDLVRMLGRQCTEVRVNPPVTNG